MSTEFRKQVEAAKRKAVTRFHDNHDDGDTAIYELVDAIVKLHEAEVEETRLITIAHVMHDLSNRMYTANRAAAEAYFDGLDAYDATQRLRAAIEPKKEGE